MANNGIVVACIVPLVFACAMAGSGFVVLKGSNAIRRTDWQSNNGWEPAPIMTPPPKIILIKKAEAQAENQGDKLSMFLPIIMSLGPVILLAILLPVFMSLLSGIMNFVKSMFSMKMSMMAMTPTMLPANMMVGNGGLPNGGIPDPMRKHVTFARGRRNSTLFDLIHPKAHAMLMENNISALQFQSL